MIRLRTRSGALPEWARRVNQFALAFLLAAACRALLPTACTSFSEALLKNACCAKAHHAATPQAPHPQHREAGEGEPLTKQVPCAFCALSHGMLEPLHLATAPLPNDAAPPAPSAPALPRSLAAPHDTPHLRGPPSIVGA